MTSFLRLQKNGKKIPFILYLAKVISIVAAARYTTDTSHNVLKATNLI
jgi:Na+/melibiose symporter-like transporter